MRKKQKDQRTLIRHRSELQMVAVSDVDQVARQYEVEFRGTSLLGFTPGIDGEISVTFAPVLVDLKIASNVLRELLQEASTRIQEDREWIDLE